MDNRIGIVDLGSNTFHLLIVDVADNKSIKTVIKQREFVGLAENGISVLSETAIQKGLETLTRFKAILNAHNVSNYKVTGTAALRSASNSKEFINKAKDELGIDIEVIGGSREAELIFKGVTLLNPMRGSFLIMDIGGGSVEFIVVRNGTMKWSRSYNIGVGVLHERYHKSEPISKIEILNLKSFLSVELQELQTEASKIDSIIGASGSFEVVESMNGNPILTDQISEVSIDEYRQVSSTLIQSSYEERSEMKNLPNSRIKLIVVAMILIDAVIEMTNPKEILISPYALKEGLLSELIK